MALTLRSQRQIQTDILNAIISRLGLTDVNPGSVLDLLTAAVSQEDFNQYVQMSQIVRLVDLDATTGEDLENRAFEYGLTRAAAVQATGAVSILRQVSGANYAKVTTSFVSAGVLAPSRGDTILNVNSTSGFQLGGTNMVVIGRGLPNEEVKLITNLSVAGIAGATTNTITIDPSSPLAFDHAFTEEVTFIPAGQLDIIISAGLTVSVPATGTNAQIDFTTSEDQTIFAGEESVLLVNVRALLAGSQGNVGTGTISVIDQTGLGVTNTSAFTTGVDLESDDSLRDRIRSHIQSLSRGTQQAVLNAIVGLVDAATSKRVVSANVVLPQTTAESVKVFIDDGTGFEPAFSPQASEVLVEDSSRGTGRLQLDFAPVVKAQIESANSEPFNLSALATAPVTTGLQLTVRIGGVGGSEETISVLTSDIEFPSTVRAEEIVKVINNKATIFEARTSETGTKLVVNAVTDTNEDIFVDRPSTVLEINDLNTYVQLTNAEQSTLYLYKNDSLLNKDGLTAAISTPTASGSSFSVTTGQNLVFEVDGKAANPQTITFNEDADLNPTTAAAIINAQGTGLIASAVENNGRLQVASTTSRSSSSSIRLLSTTTTTFNFPTTIVTGQNSDYTLNRELGTVQLATTLVSGDTITAGNAFSRASLRTPLAITSSTRINEGVGFNLQFDISGIISVNRDVIFQDDRFAAAYLDDTTRSDNTEFGFNKVTQIGNLPQYIVDYVSKQIYPFGKAVLRTIGNSQFIEIRTNTFASDDVQSSEASNATNGTLLLSRINDGSGVQRQLGIWEGVPETLIENQIPHTAFRENSVTRTFPTMPGPSAAPAGFDFSPTDTLVTVMNNDQTNGTFVLPAGNLTTSASVAEPDNATTNQSYQFVGTNLSSVYGTVLQETDNDYITTNPFAAANPWTDIPADANLLDFYVAFTGQSEQFTNGDPLQGTGTLVPNDNNSLAISPSGVFRVPTVEDINQTVTLVAGNVLTVASSTGIIAGDILTVTNSAGIWRSNDVVVASVTATTVTTDGSSTYAPVATDIITLSQRIVDRDASPVLSVSVLNGISTYTIGDGTAATPAAPNGQLLSTDFAASRLAVGDIVAFSGMGNSVNDGTFIITALSTAGVPTISVANTSGASEASASGTAILGQKRRITGYEFVTGTVTSVDETGTFGGFRDIPLVGTTNNNPADPTNTIKIGQSNFYVIANTIPNIQLQLSNSRLSSIASQAEIVVTDRGQRAQISSLMEGSAGYVEVTGGTLNNTLSFSTIANRGLQGYNYYTGLLALVHRTIYGDDTDLITFPGIGAAGVNFQVLAPTVTEIILELDVTLQQGVSIAAVENEVNTAITGYVNGLGVGEDVIVEELRARTIRINGVTDVVIIRLVGGDTTTTAISNIAIADNEIARIKVSDITLG